MKKLLLITLLTFYGKAMPPKENLAQDELTTKLKVILDLTSIKEKLVKIEGNTRLPNDIANYKTALTKRHKVMTQTITGVLPLVAISVLVYQYFLGKHFESYSIYIIDKTLKAYIAKQFIDTLSERILNPWFINPTNSDVKLEYIGMLFRYIQDNQLEGYTPYKNSFGNICNSFTLLSWINYYQFFYLFSFPFQDGPLDKSIKKMERIVSSHINTTSLNSDMPVLAASQDENSGQTCNNLDDRDSDDQEFIDKNKK